MIIWVCLPIVELVSKKTFSPKLLYWRAWEYVSNYTGKDANFAPFKPWSIYDGPLEGDLLIQRIAAHPEERRRQLFTVDEYGYRNPPHFLDTPIDAVVIGSSFVGGAAFSDDETISSILTSEYGIRTYNFFSSVQNFVENSSIQKANPKFVIILGSEGELINSYFRYNYENRIPVYKSVRYDSFEQWQNMNQPKISSFAEVVEDIKTYSLLRLISIRAYRQLLNLGRSRAEVMTYLPSEVIDYDQDTDMLFWQISYDNPILNSEGKTEENIDTAGTTLLQSALVLNQRDQILVTAAMPSKTHIELPKYQSLPLNKRALFIFNQFLKNDNEVINIDLLSPSLQMKKEGKTLYFHDDSHWNVTTNKMIAKVLAQKLCPLLPHNHQCQQKTSQPL